MAGLSSMLHAPQVQWDIHPPWVWAAFVALIWLACLASIALGWQQSANPSLPEPTMGAQLLSVRFMALLLACIALGLWCAHHVRSMPGFGGKATLDHSNGEWRLARGAEKTELLGTVRVHLDWQSALLVHFKNQNQSEWLWLESSANPTPLMAQRWIALRSALFTAPQAPSLT